MAALLALLLVQADVPALVERLRSDDVAERETAARRLEAQGLGAVAALAKATTDADLEVASRARGLLARMISPKLLQEMPDLSARAAAREDRPFAELYLRILDTWVDPPLDGSDLALVARAALRGARTVEEKRTVIAGVVRWRHRIAIPEVRTLLRDLSWEIRVSAVWALGDLESREDVPALLGLLEDREPYVVAQAVLSLTDLGVREALPRILPLLRSADVTVRNAAARAAASFGAREAVPDLLAALRRVATPAVARALAHLDAKDAVPEIRKLLVHPESEIRKAAEEAIRELGE